MNQIELAETIDRLLMVMRADRKKIDQRLVEEGEALLALFTDETMAKKGRDFTECREFAIRDAIEDLANGAPLLAAGTIGVKYEDGQLTPFAQKNSESNQVNTAYSIRLKKTAAFKAWRGGDSFEMPQEQLNACVYFLITQLV
jgi:hypothetical protein